VQHADGSVTARCLGGDPAGLRKALEALLDRPVTVETVAAAADLGPGKPRRFTSAT
jgi:phenylacetate-CoA ligase